MRRIYWALLLLLLLLLGLGLLVPYIVIYEQNEAKLANRPVGSPITTVMNVGTRGFGFFKQITATMVIQMYNFAGNMGITVQPNASLVLDTINSQPLSGGSATQIPLVTVDAKGRVTNVQTMPLNRIQMLNGKSEHVVFSGGANIVIMNTTSGLKVSTTNAIQLETLILQGGATFEGPVVCEAPLDGASCFDLSMQSCSEPLDASCMPQNFTFDCLTVKNLTADFANLPISNQTALSIDELTVTDTLNFNGPVTCTEGAKLDASCVQIQCANGPFSESCFPDSQSYDTVNISQTLTVNNVECLGGPLDASCIQIDGQTCMMPMDASCTPPGIQSINGVSETNFMIVGGGSTTVNGLDITSTAENNTGINVPGSNAIPIFKQKNGVVLEFKNIVGGNGTSVSLENDVIEINLMNSTANDPSGTFTNANITVDEFGRVVEANDQPPLSSTAAMNVGNLGVGILKQLSGGIAEIHRLSAPSLSLVGDVLQLGLPDSPVVPGTYGNASHMPLLTVNQKGQVTAVSTYELKQKAGTVAYSVQGQSYTSSSLVLAKTFTNTCPSCVVSGNQRFNFPRSGVYTVMATAAGTSLRLQCSGFSFTGFSNTNGIWIATTTKYFNAGDLCQLVPGLGSPRTNSIFFSIHSLF